MKQTPTEVKDLSPFTNALPSPYAGGVRGGSDEPPFLGLIVAPPEYYSHKE